MRVGGVCVGCGKRFDKLRVFDKWWVCEGCYLSLRYPHYRTIGGVLAAVLIAAVAFRVWFGS